MASLAARFPLTLGGPDRTEEQEHQALLDAYAPGWDVSDGTEMHANAGMEALAVSMIWVANRRFSKQLIPTKMIDMLDPYERACQLRPSADASPHERRRALAAKLRGQAGNLFSDIAAAAQSAAGGAYVTTIGPATADIYSYLPGINPGPPGYEFSSNRAHIAVHLRTDAQSQSAFRRTVRLVRDAVESVKPAWLRVTVGIGDDVDSAFVCGVGIVGLTVI